MSDGKPVSSAGGLRGQSAGSTAICTVGFGHAVYRYSDPRNAVIKECARRLAASAKEGDGYLFAISEEVETVMREKKGLFANADFFSASSYHFMGVPMPLFTPIFVLARVTGWATHIKKQRANNKLIRPLQGGRRYEINPG